MRHVQSVHCAKCSKDEMPNEYFAQCALCPLRSLRAECILTRTMHITQNAECAKCARVYRIAQSLIEQYICSELFCDTLFTAEDCAVQYISCKQCSLLETGLWQGLILPRYSVVHYLAQFPPANGVSCLSASGNIANDMAQVLLVSSLI
jgi:hypothetical protein